MISTEFGSGDPARTTRAKRSRLKTGTARYWWFIGPSVMVIFSIVLFPWLFTIWMSTHEWSPGSPPSYVGLQNYSELIASERFVGSVGRTLYFTALAVIIPLFTGTFSALVFHREFPLRGLLRGIFILPMMATPVAIALVWTMMFHPQLGILNYLLSLVGIPPSLWVYSATTVIPSLVLVEVWHWTPLVALIVLGGLAALPVEPYEAAKLDGASRWQTFRYVTLPLVLPDIVAGSEFRDVFGVALTNMLAPGANAAAELKKATESFRPILERTEKA